MRRRIFDIIQIGNKEDGISRAFDYAIVVVILLNILSLFLSTFDQFAEYSAIFRIVEYVTTAVFLVEYILRIITADYLYPDKKKGVAIVKFLFSFDGITDLLTIISVFSLYGFVAFRLIRVIRIFHLFRLNSQYDSFQVIISVLKERWKQIVSALVIIMILMLASSISMYSLEHEAQPEAFANAFSGIWWSVSCLLTVGYGDLYPVTIGGQILAIVIAFLGVGVVAIPTGIISAGFVDQFTQKSLADDRITDTAQIGEIKIHREHEWIGKTVFEIKKHNQHVILLIVRNGLSVLPLDSVTIIEDDILVLQSDRLDK